MLKEMIETLNKLNESWLTEIEHEIIIINDYSSDNTVNLIENNISINIFTYIMYLSINT